MAAIVLDGDEARDELIVALLNINAEAMACKPSPRYDALHGMLNSLLDKVVGL